MSERRDPFPLGTFAIPRFRSWLLAHVRKDDIERAERERHPSEGSVLDTLVRLGLLEANRTARLREEFAEEIALQPLSRADIEALPRDPGMTQGLSVAFLKKNLLFPLFREGSKLFVLAAGDRNFDLATRLARREIDLARAHGRDASIALLAQSAKASEVRILLASEVDFREVFDGSLARKPPREAPPPEPKPAVEGFLRIESPEDEAGEAVRAEDEPGALQFVKQVLSDAIALGASDIHLQPERDRVACRLRVDGLLREHSSIDDRYTRAVAGVVKAHAGLKIEVREAAQDGRLDVSMSSGTRSFRVSTLPSAHGESIVLRVLARAGEVPSLDACGLSGERLARYMALVERPSGILLVTGPTGCGKSTTIASTLLLLSRPEVKVVTLEDPIERTLPGIVQSPVRPVTGHTFAAGLRAILRHDPDVILIGEIRDLETAEIAIEAALTGHLVFSTLHTNDAPRTVTRLVDLGVPGYLIEESVAGVLAQRLVRRLCREPRCREPYPSGPEEHSAFGLEVGTLLERPRQEGGGCPACSFTRYSGRVGLYELLSFDEAVRRAIRAGAGADDLRTAARAGGFTDLWDDARSRILAGDTTFAEVRRILGPRQGRA